MVVEPSFASGRPVWPHAGMGSDGREPDDSDLAIPAGISGCTAHALQGKALPAWPDETIGRAAREPMQQPPAAVPGRRIKWRLALAASCLLHAAAATFLISANSEAVLIEGADLSGVASHGNASEDQMPDDELAPPSDAVEVTMITMLDARPVETMEAETLPADEVAEAVEVVEPEAAAIETVQPLAPPVARPVDVAKPEPVARVDLSTAIFAEAESVEAAVKSPVSNTDPALEILATDRQETVDNNVVQQSVAAEPLKPRTSAEPNAVQPSSPDRVKPAAAAEVQAAQAESASSPARTAPQSIDAVPADSIEAAMVEPAESEVSEVLADVAQPPLPMPRPEIRKPTGQQPAPQTATRPREVKKGVKAAARPAAKAKKSGSGGSNKADARRGQADGRENGQAASKARGGKSSAAGNAAVSNYPGKVASKLRRALRYPAAAKRQRLRGQVRVGFVVAANGSVASIRVVSSSGSPLLDDAALEAVRRAAPFPDIPPGAGRTSWPFTVPLAFSR